MNDETLLLAKRFMALFAGLERAHGVYKIPNRQAAEGEKVKGRALTEHKPVTVDLWAQHLEGKQGIGIIPIRDDNTVSWAAIDVDVYPLDLVELERKVIEQRMPLVVVRSKSGGAHLFLFCAEPLPARYVRAKLEGWVVALGYPKLEIFPKQNVQADEKDVGNWINMPYFLASESARYAVYNGKRIDANTFLELGNARRVTKEQLDAFAVGVEESFADAPPCLQHLVKAGFPKGTRNKGLFSLGVFARLRFGDEWKERVDEFNRAYMSPPLSTGEVMTTLKSLSRKEYFYSCSQDPIASVCNKEICRTRKYGIGTSDVSAPPVQIGGITKIASDPPMYRVEVEGKQIECTADDILQQLRFRKLVFERVNKIIPLLKGNIWETMINEKMGSLEIEEAPDDAGPEGQFLSHLEHFCTSRVTANTLDEILLGKPFVDETNKRTVFRSPDLLRYLEQQHFREFNERKIWSVLKRMDCAHRQLSIKGKCVTVWEIPSFAKQDESYDTPRIEGDEM